MERLPFFHPSSGSPCGDHMFSITAIFRHSKMVKKLKRLKDTKHLNEKLEKLFAKNLKRGYFNGSP
jgi:hypothetical protein